MRFEVETGGRRHTIDVQTSPDGWVVSTGGRTRQVSLAPIGNRWSMLVREADPTDPGDRVARSYEVTFEPGGRGRRLVHIGGRVVPVTFVDPAREDARGHRDAGASGRESVASPMAGRVVKLLVAPGDTVSAGQGLVVVESMKMENELRARRAGTVLEVRAREGEPVDARAELIVLGP